MNIGITGSIACGKSTVSNYLIAKGYTIIDADKIGHVALTSNDAKRKLSEKFGDEILENNEINREKLGKLVFGNDDNLKILNSIIHPKIKELILKLQEEHKDEDLVFLDIALLYEANFVDLVEKVAVVYVDKAVQLGLIPEALKESQLKQFEADFDGQKAVLSKLVADKEAENTQQGKANIVREVVLGAGAKPTGTADESFDYLQKKNPARLRAIRDKEPEEYARLAKEYANGVRYTEK